VSNQITPISTSHGRGLQTTRPIMLTIILLAWIGLPVVAWPPPSSLTTKAGNSSRSVAQSADEALSLEPGKPVERELSGGGPHFYKITMTSGQYLRIAVSQRGIDVLVTLFTPDGKKIGEVDSRHVIEGSENFSVIAESSGEYRIEARSAEKTAKAGRYEIKVAELREATTEDKYRVAAESLSREAGRLKRGTLEAKKEGIEKYQEALELYRKAGDHKGEAETIKNIGAIYYSLGEMQKALEKFTEYLSITRVTGNRRWESAALHNIGSIYREWGEMQKSLEKFNESLSISRDIGDREGEAGTLREIGAVYWSLGDMQRALEKFNDALPILQAVGNRSGEASTLNNIGVAYAILGEMQKALEKFNEAMKIRRVLGDRNGEVIIINNIGGIYQKLGDLRTGLDKWNEALTICREIGDRIGEAYALKNIGGTYRSLGEMRKALEKFNDALSILQTVGDRRQEAITLSDIGEVYQSLGETQKALEMYNEALRISRSVGNRDGEAAALKNIGLVNQSLGERQKALENFNEALSIRRAVGNIYGEADTMLGIARLEEEQGNLTLAHQAIERAIAIVESVRANVGLQQLRTSYMASRQKYYESYIDILMKQHRENPSAGFDAAAFAISERSRARSMLDLLMESRINIRQGVDSSLLERERSLQRLLNAKAAAQFALLSGKHTPAQAEAVAKDIASITTEYEELKAQIRKRSPRYADLTQPQPLGLAEIQRQVLDSDTLLLEYSLGDDASYLFVVSPTSITIHRLPNLAELEVATRRVRDLLTAPQPQPGDTEAKYQARIKEARENYWPRAAELSRMLLGPAASQLGGKRLLIVADGPLQYLPFGALPAPETEGQRDKETRGQGDRGTRRQGKSPLPTPHSPPPVPLIVDHEIVHLPSASTLAVLRRDLDGRQPAAKTVAVLADPVFSADDARVKSGAKAQTGEEAPPDLTRAISDVRGELSRLLLTRDEAEAILSVAPRTDGFGALDFRANRTTATSDELSRYRIVHFATHGLLNSEHPELSGVVLSLVDERGQPQDGFLRLHEIFNLRLPAELVVLSACQTGLGKEVKGEGLVGLTRGFMYAGAARVVASLWQVNDAATAELMKRFYRRMLKDGMRPAAALRAAQIEMWKKPQWQSPFYWGGFALQGEWK
jgi:tetratricopeptide (TPR) repeat protein